MRKNIIVTVASGILTGFTVFGQTWDRPQNNFYAGQGNKQIEYRKVFDDRQDSAAVIKKKIKALITSSPGIFTQVQYDSNICSGNLNKIYPAYYRSSKELTGTFKIEVKNGRYRVTITGMTLIGSIFNDDLGDVVMNDNGMEWNTAMVANLLPDLDDNLTKVFSLVPAASSNW
ncbi:MAG: hypothetical protein HKL88_08985 [Bacteroidia bacterium]|jgi:hypothetical protein|nr:hypothetical protein [Bacteroidia bacterium]